MIKSNTSTCAYDSFGQELYKDDQVLCSSIECGRIMLYKGKVTGWTAKRIDIEVQEITSNTDIQEDIVELIGTNIGDIVRVKPDRICKI